uniref:nicotinate-nucleotide pyrophosphorylase [carboxylating] n=1 Tax=Myxine glutinosa TaxID=7769 RepID=UPI00358EF83E
MAASERKFRGNLAHVLPPHSVSKLVRAWLHEDVPGFDVAGMMVGDREGHAALLCKTPGVLAGAPFVSAIFSELCCTVEWFYDDGDEPLPHLSADPCRVAVVSGPMRNILLGERAALNCIARASGIATVARRACQAAQRWHGRVLGTRKTTPGFRLVEKYALAVGGAGTHRHNLSDTVMLKDNHIWAIGSISEAVQEARYIAGYHTKIEVECRTDEEAKEAGSAGADIIMLDNIPPPALHNQAQKLKAEFPNLIIEASGGVTQDNLASYLGPNVDAISLGCLTQGYPIVDFSLKILREWQLMEKESKDKAVPACIISSPKVAAHVRRDYAF